jgi:hypothetical protein
VYATDYRANRPAVRVATRDYNAQILSFAARQFITNAANHVATTLTHRTQAYVQGQLGIYMKEHPDEWKGLKKHKRSIVRWVTSHCLEWDGTLERQWTPKSRGQPLSMSAAFRAAMDRLVATIRSRIGADHLPVTKQRQQKKWDQYLPWLYFVGAAFEAEHNRVAKETEDSGQLKGLRLFSLLPVHSPRPVHIQIDTQALWQLLRKANLVPRTLTTDAFHRDRDVYWAKYLKLPKRQWANTTQTKQFARSIRTDGFTCSVLMTRPARKCPLGDPNLPARYAKRTAKKHKRNTGDAQQVVQAHNEIGDKTRFSRVVGIDPGRKNVFTAAIDEAGERRFTKCSTREYYHLLRHHPLNDRIKRKLQTHPTLKEYAAGVNVPSVKTLQLAGIVRYLQYIMPLVPDLLAFYTQPPIARAKLARYTNKQKAMHMLCKRIVGEKKKQEVLVGFGNPTFSSCVERTTKPKCVCIALL